MHHFEGIADIYIYIYINKNVFEICHLGKRFHHHYGSFTEGTSAALTSDQRSTRARPEVEKKCFLTLKKKWILGNWKQSESLICTIPRRSIVLLAWQMGPGSALGASLRNLAVRGNGPHIFFCTGASGYCATDRYCAVTVKERFSPQLWSLVYCLSVWVCKIQ